MAEITWRNIEAPRFDVRDFAIASNQMTGGLDRLAEMFMNRETEARRLATNNAVAGVIGMQDPTQLAAALGGLAQAGAAPNSRVDLRTVLEAGNAHRGDLVRTNLSNENLLNTQAQTALGAEMAGLRRAAEAGDTETQALYEAKIAADPLGSRVALQAEEGRSEGFGLFDRRERDTRDYTRLTARDARSDMESDRSFSLQQQEAAARNAERAAARADRRAALGLTNSAVQLGDDFAERYGTNTDAMKQDPRYTQLNATQRELAVSVATDRGAALEKASPRSREILGRYVPVLNEQRGLLEGRIAAAEETVMSSPGARVLERMEAGRKRDEDGKLLPEVQPTAEEVTTELDRSLRFMQGSRTFLAQQRAKGFSDAEILAAAQSVPSPSIFTGNNEQGATAIAKVLDDVRDVRAKGGVESLRNQVREATKNERSALNGLTRIEENIQRRVNAGQEVRESDYRALANSIDLANSTSNPAPNVPAGLPAPFSEGPAAPPRPIETRAPVSGLGPGGGRYSVSPESDPYLSAATRRSYIEQLEIKARNGSITEEEQRRLDRAKARPN